MKSRLWLAALLALTSVAGMMCPTAAQAQAARKRIAVMDFDFGTVSRWWKGDWDVGKGLSDIMVTNLVKDGTYSVIERKRLADVLGEQNLGQSGRTDNASAAKVGKILGVQAIVVGSITQFGFDDKNINIGAAGGLLGGPFAGIGLGKKKSKAIVVIDARLVDTNTGEILAVATGKGESRRDSFSGFGGGGGRGGFGAGGIDMSSSNFENTIIGEATRKCVDALTADLVKSQDKLVAQKIEVSGRVADVDAGKLILNVGKESGLHVGDTLNVERVVREVKDPDTGKVLREVTEVVGTVKITELDEKSAVGTFNGAGAPKVGDRVKLK